MPKGSIPNVLNKLLELPGGQVLEVDSLRWFSWLRREKSFRFDDVPSSYTCRKEKIKGTDYWYGYQRTAGEKNPRKRYIGKSADVTWERLVEVGELFGQAPQSKKVLPKTELGDMEELRRQVEELTAEVEQLRADSEAKSAEVKEAVEILERALKLKANAGGAIKDQIKRSLRILNK